jgi:hypothetical protein
MKKIAILILVTAMINGCKKGGKDYSAIKNSLVNKWELRTSIGGISGRIIYQPGNGNIFEFKRNDSFAQYGNGNIFQSGTYSLQSTSEPDQYRITYHINVRELSQNLVLKGDTLVLLKMEPCCDFPDDTYVRINN